MRAKTFASVVVSIFLLTVAATAFSQTRTVAPQTVPTKKAVTHADVLRGEYGRYRANNDLLFYNLDIRVDPEKKFINGKNTIRFKMLKDDNRIQLDLYDNLKIDEIVFEPGSNVLSPRLGDPSSKMSDPTILKYTRDSGALFVDFPKTLKAGRIYTIDFYYSGTPQTIGRFGGFTFSKDPAGRPWIFTACEGEGASIWWPNKDQWRDEPESMRIDVEVPTGLTDVSNGKFFDKRDLGDGYTRWEWLVQYPINNYDVSLNIGNYVHFDDKLGDLSLDFYALPEDLDKAKKQFAQAKGMLEAYQHYFGDYPFKKDGYKLIQAPYSGMEHQSAVTYGNHFANGYLERDWTGVGISPKFDFIIIHESGHEWFGNSVTAADRSDMWIHEGWTTYLECLYVEFMFGKDDGLRYTNGYQNKVRNQQPIVAQRGVNATPPQDMYFKGALFINTLRSVVNNDKRWWALLRDFYQHFKYQTIMTEDVVRYFNQKTGMKLTPVFDQYLRHTALPVLELKFDEAGRSVQFRWQADEPGFAMPIRVGTKNHWQTIQPTTEWKQMKTGLKKDQFQVATDLYFVDVRKL
ncbi:MAG TPA: M1 family metallopeptidase [Pyrinomonadaceae bacterium]|jgi:aminopeptidase N|nr:M1 family metallopeptidase [Pyrinomonadaceae bacterium]